MAGLSELREARALAHRLSSECRESPYRPLAAKLRSLRNLLEDIEDSFDGAAESSSAYGYVLERIIHTKLVLAQLSLAVQQTTNLPEAASTSTSLEPGVFQGLIDDTTTKLSSAHDAMLTPEQPPVSSLLPETTSVTKNEAISAGGLFDEEHISQSENVSASPALKPNGWSDIYLDPLSTPIEQATSIILGEDPDPKPRARGMSMRSERDSILPSLQDPGEGYHVSPESTAVVGVLENEDGADRAAEAPEVSRPSSQGDVSTPYPAPLKIETGESPPPRDLSSKKLPPLPGRRPPLPPRPTSASSHPSTVSPRQSTENQPPRLSRYRIVNPDPSHDAVSLDITSPTAVSNLPSPPIATPEIVIDTSALQEHPSDSSASLPIVLITEHPDEPRPAPPVDVTMAGPGHDQTSLPSPVPSDLSNTASITSSTARAHSSSEQRPAVDTEIEGITRFDHSESSLELDTRTHRSSSMPSQSPGPGMTTSLLHISQDVDNVTPVTQRRNRSQSDLNASMSQPRVSVDSLTRTSFDGQLPQRPRTEIFDLQGSNSPAAPWNMTSKATGPAAHIVHDVNNNRVHQIVDTWNRCLWDVAETYLTAHLSNLMDTGERLAERRTRHLLGVCASFQGHSSKAIAYFLSVLRAPVVDVDDLDVGDCAAAYWLADEYALLNRRAEALLAYSIAERSPLYQDIYNVRLSQCIWAERRNCLRGVGRNDFQQYTVADDMTAVSRGQPGASLLEPATVGPAAARALLDVDFRKSKNAFVPTFELDTGKSRAATLSGLHSTAQGISPARYYGIRITADMLYPDSYWPMAYDPFYCSANVARGRLLLNESDMLRVFTTVPDAKIPRSGPLDSSRKDCFHCSDLVWLINALRNCLLMLGMEWSEVANVEGSWFVVRYAFVEHHVRVATTHYFTISLFRPSFRTGYGCEICPEGSMSASRVINIDPSYQRGVHLAEPKRLRKLIRESLDEQAKQRVKPKRQSGIGSVTGASEMPVRYG